VRYRLNATPLIVHACHCTDCQRITGSAFVVNIWIEREFVEVFGTRPKSFTLRKGTGRDHEVFFCGACGTYVWSRYQQVAGDALFVRAGTLDKPRAVKPDVHIFTRSKTPWLELSAGAPAFRAFYPMGKVWPAASLERLRGNIAEARTASASRKRSGR
jgi:hypothetical protein